jgi:hypothetical protein
MCDSITRVQSSEVNVGLVATNTALCRYYNKEMKRLFFIPNGTNAQPPARVVASHLQTLVRIKGNQSSPVQRITISGVGWRDAAPTFMERFGVPSGGDWSMFHGAALDIHGAEDVVVDGCRFERLDNNAILLSG